MRRSSGVDGAIGEEVGPSLQRPPERLAQPPAADRAVVAGHEDGRNVVALEDGRPRVLRVLEEPVGERLLGGRGGVDRARQEAEDRVDDDERRAARRPVST